MGFFSSVKSTDARRAAQLVATGEATLLDVRQDVEWKAGRVRGALHIPLVDVSRRADELPRGQTIITVCRSGHRSASAARRLHRAGYRVENLHGGMKSWAKEGLPLDPPGGKVL